MSRVDEELAEIQSDRLTEDLVENIFNVYRPYFDEDFDGDMAEDIKEEVRKLVDQYREAL